jgi:hypothetical protein
MKSWLIAILIAVLAAFLLLPFSPLYRPAPADDASIYLYIADRILEGKTPYVDGWDQKPPLIYFIFALARAATPQSIWGLWFLEWAGWVIMGVAGYWVLSRAVRPWISFLAIAASFLVLVEFYWGGSIEDTALMFQMLSVVCFTRLVACPGAAFRPWDSLAAGILAGVLFFMKQNLVAVSLSIGLYVLAQALIRRDQQDGRDRRSWLSLAWMAAGALLVALLIVAYFWARGGLVEYWRQAFVFNWMYSNLGLLERANALLDGLEFLSGYPGMYLALALWLAGLALALTQLAPLALKAIQFRYTPWLLLAGGAALAAAAGIGEALGKTPGIGLAQAAVLTAGIFLLSLGVVLAAPSRRDNISALFQRAPSLSALWNAPQPSFKITLLNFSVLYFLLALVLIATSGRNYVYYFIPLAPPAMLLSGLLIDFYLLGSSQPRSLLAGIVLIAALVIVLSIRPFLLVVNGYRTQINPPPSALESHILTTTNADDTILVWGRFTTHLYTSTNRKSPTRFYNQAAFHLPAYMERFNVNETLLAELRAAPPKLVIIDQNYLVSELMPADICSNPAAGDRSSLLVFLCQRYMREKTFGEQVVFRRTR